LNEIHVWHTTSKGVHTALSYFNAQLYRLTESEGGCIASCTCCCITYCKLLAMQEAKSNAAFQRIQAQALDEIQILDGIKRLLARTVHTEAAYPLRDCRMRGTI